MSYKIIISLLLVSAHLIQGVETRLETFYSLTQFAKCVLESGYSLENSLVALDLDGTLIELDERGIVRLLDPDTARIIRLLQDSGCIVIGLTARHPESAGKTLRQLQKVGITFASHQNLTPSFEYKFFRKGQPHPCKFDSDILFVGKNEKGKALLGFDSIMSSKHEGWVVRYFFFLDNTRAWVERFQQRFEKVDSSERFALAGHFNPMPTTQPQPLFEDTRKQVVQAIETLWAWLN